MTPKQQVVAISLLTLLLGVSSFIVAASNAYSAQTNDTTTSLRPETTANPALHRGINLSAWLAEPLRQKMYQRDVAQLKAAGFDFVRLPVDPKLFHFTLEGSLPVSQELDFQAVDGAIATVSPTGLAIVLDIHPVTEFMQTLEAGGQAEDRFVEFWANIAAHYNKTSPRTLVYQLLNEPQYYEHADQFNHLAARLVAAIRKVDSRRLIIIQPSAITDASPTLLIRSLQSLDLVDDPNIAYDVHYYMPYIVTHQGATFAFQGTPIADLRRLPYPSDLVDKAHVGLAPGADQAAAMRAVDKYVAEEWNRSRIESYVSPAADWARAHHARLLVLEFGVLRTQIDPESRYRWIADARSTFDTYGIGWAVFDYADIFGIVKQYGESTMDNDGAVRFVHPETGIRKIEPAAIEALGLPSRPAYIK